MGTNTYVYKVEGDILTGTLDDYAQALEMTHYLGLDVEGLWQIVDLGHGFGLTLDKVQVETESHSGDHNLYVTITVGRDESKYKIDLLA